MNEAERDTKRARLAAAAVIGDRSIGQDDASIMVTLEHTVAAVLLALYRDPAMAARMLNEGLVPGVEERLSLYASRRPS